MDGDKQKVNLKLKPSLVRKLEKLAYRLIKTTTVTNIFIKCTENETTHNEIASQSFRLRPLLDLGTQLQPNRRNEEASTVAQML